MSRIRSERLSIFAVLIVELNGRMVEIVNNVLFFESPKDKVCLLSQIGVYDIHETQESEAIVNGPKLKICLQRGVTTVFIH